MSDDYEVVPTDAGPDWQPKDYKSPASTLLRQLFSAAHAEPGKPDDLKVGHAKPEHP
jgi:hypothetical protein